MNYLTNMAIYACYVTNIRNVLKPDNCNIYFVFSPTHNILCILFLQFLVKKGREMSNASSLCKQVMKLSVI